MKVLDLFSGIGGFSLGLEAAGMKTVAFCEIVPHARAVIDRHWPGVPIYDDITTVTAENLASDGVTVDVICGGFPCQDISLSGSGAGLDGVRSGLWFEMLRVISEVRPRWALIENVAALRARGLDEVLRGLASIGYDAEWHCIPASAVGAPHRRDRIWIVAHPNRDARDKRGVGHTEEGARGWDVNRSTVGETMAYSLRLRSQGAEPVDQKAGVGRRPSDPRSASLADAHKPRLEIKLHGEAGEQPAVERTHAWSVEPDVGRVAYGVPSRVDRITRLGNAVVPQVPEAVGRAIMKWEATQ